MPPRWILEVLTDATESYVHIFVADVIKSFDTVDRGIRDCVLGRLGVAWLVSQGLFRLPCPGSAPFQACGWSG